MRDLRLDNDIEIDEATPVSTDIPSDISNVDYPDFEEASVDESNYTKSTEKVYTSEDDVINKHKSFESNSGTVVGESKTLEGKESKRPDISSYRKALAYILDNGPRMGVNTLLQVDQPSKILYEDYVNAKFVYGKFNHLVMLRSEEKAASPLGLSDEIHLNQLPSEDERLRAIYYDSGSDKYQMFTPYIIK
jgi:hypothetical protein